MMNAQATYQPLTAAVQQRCTNPDCRATYPRTEVLVGCKKCGSLLDIEYDWEQLGKPSFEVVDERRSSIGFGREEMLNYSGVWRFRDFLPFYETEDQIVTLGEGHTLTEHHPGIAKEIGMTGEEVYLHYEGYNPSGSFKDNGMTAGFTHATLVGASRVACASTGNTSASMALYASRSGMEGFVFIGSGKIAYGKLSQALDYGATTLQVLGDFDACLKRVAQIATQVPQMGIYLMNSLNPFRLEGQKTIMLRILERFHWQVPDWIVVPGGNLGNSSSFGKAFKELFELGLIDRIPRLAIIQAAGANPLYEMVYEKGMKWNDGRWDRGQLAELYEKYESTGQRAKTIASAIEIGRPVNYAKALRALEVMNGIVRQVPDDVILEHKALVGKYGCGCEPASAASVAGVRQLREEGVIKPEERVVCVLTGHQLKDPDATVNYHTGIDMKATQESAPRSEPHGEISNRPIQVEDDLAKIIEAMGGDPQWADAVE